jgi:hypothetical protein
MDIRLILDERLGAIAVMDIPIKDEDPLQSMPLSRVVRCQRDVTEETEPHRPVAHGVMSRRPHRGKASRVLARDR